MAKKYDVVVAGYLCVDMVPRFKISGSEASLSELLQPGKLVEIDGMGVYPGGVVANSGMSLKKFGKNVYLNGLIGDDFVGKILINILQQYELSEGIKITANAGTAFGIVLAPKGVDRIFLESPGCSQVYDITNVDLDIVAASRIFHFGYPPLLKKFYNDDGALLVSLFTSVRHLNVITSLDFSLPDSESESGKVDWQSILHKTLPLTDIFVPSLEEIFQILMPEEHALMAAFETGDYIDNISMNAIQEIGRQVINMGVKILLIKAGHRGSYLLTAKAAQVLKKSANILHAHNWNNRELWCDAYPAEQSRIKNASGAGDASAAAFLTAILDGEDPETAVRYAAVAGRNNLYCDNIYEQLSSWQELTEQIENEEHSINHFTKIS